MDPYSISNDLHPPPPGNSSQPTNRALDGDNTMERADMAVMNRTVGHSMDLDRHTRELNIPPRACPADSTASNFKREFSGLPFDHKMPIGRLPVWYSQQLEPPRSKMDQNPPEMTPTETTAPPPMYMGNPRATTGPLVEPVWQDRPQDSRLPSSDGYQPSSTIYQPQPTRVINPAMSQTSVPIWETPIPMDSKNNCWSTS